MDQTRRADTLTDVGPIERVADGLKVLGVQWPVVEHAGGTDTAEAAAAAVGCQLGQIVKTLCFLADGRPTLALVAGDRQVDTALLATLLGVPRKRLRMGSAAEVLAITGYPVGGVSPIAPLERCDVVIDRSLDRFSEVWVAAGNPHSVFCADLATLARLLGAQWAEISRGPSNA